MWNLDGMADSHVLDWLAVLYDSQNKLCGLLEDIADALPESINGHFGSLAVPGLRTLVAHHSAIEGHILFPILRRRVDDAEILDTLIDRIAQDNASDELLAHDVADTLEAAITGERPANPGMLAYMLRGLFDGRRRHIAWERIALIPLARDALTPEDLVPLTEADVRKLTSAERAHRKNGCG